MTSTGTTFSVHTIIVKRPLLGTVTCLPDFAEGRLLHAILVT